MSTPFFRFKQFTIHQDRCAMKVGTDGVLLGAWAEIAQAGTLLDIGTGSGLIAIMAAQRNANAHIHAIEINPEACGQAKENIAASPWADRITLFQGAVQTFYPGLQYDRIICNPPFFIHSTPNPEPGRSMARHGESLSYPDLLTAAERLLAPEGKLQLILPAVEANIFLRQASSRGWFANRITYVHPTPEKPPKRHLMEFSKTRTTCMESIIIIETERHIYHETHASITRDFYLKG